MQVEDETHASALTAAATPPPTVETRPESANADAAVLAAAAAEDSWQFEPGKAYRWKDWRVIKSRDSLFIWCDALALELRWAGEGEANPASAIAVIAAMDGSVICSTGD